MIRKVSDLQRPIRSLQSELAHAKPVNENWRYTTHLDVEAEYPHIPTQHQEKAQRVDGLWVCHCGHENELQHYAGQYPFKKLVCENEKCRHMFCDRCPASEILTRITVEPTEVFSLRFQRAQNESYCSIYTHCGLSHRANMSGGCLDFSGRCRCGHKEKDGARAFYIGSSYEYRRNPEEKAQALRIQRHIKPDAKADAITPAFRPGSAPACATQTMPPPIRVSPPTPPLTPTRKPAAPVRAPGLTPWHVFEPTPVHEPIRHQDTGSAQSQKQGMLLHPPPQLRASTSSKPVHTVDLLEDAWAGA